MITKNITCRELTFESAKEIIDYAVATYITQE